MLKCPQCGSSQIPSSIGFLTLVGPLRQRPQTLCYFNQSESARSSCLLAHGCPQWSRGEPLKMVSSPKPTWIGTGGSPKGHPPPPCSKPPALAAVPTVPSFRDS